MQTNFNLEAEQQLLGAIIMINDLVVNLEIESDYFAHQSHLKIFQYIENCLKSDSPANFVSLSNFFESLPEGKEYLKFLQLNASAVFAKEHVKTLRELAQKRKLEALTLEIKEMCSDASKNSQEIKDIASQRLEEISISKTKQSISLGDAVRDSFSKKHTNTISSGYKTLDSVINGFDLGDLVVLAGRPSMGKSCLATNIAIKHAQENQPVLLISLEMKADQLSKRIVANLASIHLTKLKNNNLTSQHEVEAFQRAVTNCDKLPITIEDNGGLTLPRLRYLVKRFVNKKKGKLVIIDYIQLIKHKTKGQRVDDVTEITNTLKEIAMEFNIVILGLSQLSRAVESREDKRPMLSDLRESGSLEQDASIVLFTYRPEYYCEREKGIYEEKGKLREWENHMRNLKGKAFVIAAKVRDGECGEAQLGFEGAFQRFYE